MDQPRRRTLLCAASCAFAGALVPLSSLASTTSLAPLRALLQQAPSGIDYGKAKLTIDKMVAPSLDYDAARREIDRLLYAAQRLIATVPVPLSPYEQKVEALRAVIYAPGVWNGFRPFMYDLENDPMGTANPLGPLLPNYLETRRGQCISMPALFLALAQRIGLDAHLSTAPFHTFVKTRRPDGTYANHECTHEAGPKADASYIRENEITPVAVHAGIYLQPLTPRRAVVVMSNPLACRLADKGDSSAAHQLADLLLEFEPDSFDAIFSKLAAYSSMQTPYLKYRRIADMPRDVYAKVRWIDGKLDEWEAKVRAMGWRPESNAVRENAERVAREAAIERKGSR